VPRALAAALFVCVIAEALCALAVLVLAFALPAHMFVAVNLFGIFVALRAMIILGYGFARGTLFYRMRPVFRREHPARFWLLVGFNAVAVFVGLFLTRLPID
jgi:hypothetical protein